MSVDPNNLAGTAKLTFNDDFNTLNLWNGSSGVWSTTFWYQGSNSPGATISTTNEQEWYINAEYGPTSYLKPWTVNNGVLTLQAAPASSYTQSLIGNYLYTSGEVNTVNSFAQTYGYFEMRAQLPAGQGFWPAFWLMPENGSTLPELDVVEVLSNNPTELTGSSHSAVSGMIANKTQVTNTTTGYHTYGMDWEPDFITWYFDGQKVYQIATPSDMNVPMYMIANLAVGGFGGSGDGVTTGNMQIDYIRAYQALNPGGSATTSYDAATDTFFTNGNGALAANIHNLTLTGAGQTVSGNALGNVILSNNNNNNISGGDGDDVIVAGRGHDILTGGAGADTFVYDEFPWDIGQITDFTLWQDQVDLRGVLNGAGYTGSDPVGAGYLTLKANGAGVTEVWFDPDGWGPGGAYWMFNMANVQASQLQVRNGFIVTAGMSPFAYSRDGTSAAPPPTQPSSPPATQPPPTSGGGSGSSTVSVSDGYYVAPAGVTSIALSGWNQTVQANAAGDTIYSNNSANKLLGGTGNDTFYLGRGGDSAASGGGTDTFVFKEVPWTAGHISGFTGQDVIDLAFLKTYGYWGSDPIAEGRVKLVADGAGGTQVWAVLDGLPGGSGTWLVTTVDGLSPANLKWENGHLVDPPTAGGSTGGGSTGGGSTGGGSTGGGQTFTSDNWGDHWTGTAGNDTFNLGRGGDVVAGGGGNDVFKFAEVPWAGGHITDFGQGDVLDLSGLFTHSGYWGSNPLAEGRLKLVDDGQGGTQVWAVLDGLPGASGSWLVTDLDHVAPSSLSWANGQLTTGQAASGGGSTGGGSTGQTFTSDNWGDHWTGTAGNDTFNLGRGGDVVTGGGGNDTFKFAEIPWAGGHITDFGQGDALDLTAMFTRYGYYPSDPVAEGRLKLVDDGHGDTQVWFTADGLSGAYGTWLLTTLDHQAPSTLHVSAGWITG